MSCLRFRDYRQMERYLRQELPEQEAASFEAHVLECDDCAEALERLVTLRAELERRRPEIDEEQKDQPASSWRVWLALAALFVMVAGLLLVLRPWAQDDLASLAYVEPPAYHESQLRGVVDEADERYRAAMVLYQDTDYRGAMRQLEAAAMLDPDRLDVQFFLGACRLLNGEVDGALGNLDRVIAEGDTPFLEEALFLRAQGYLLRGELDAAEADLRSILELESDWESRARDQFEQLETWSAAQG